MRGRRGGKNWPTWNWRKQGKGRKTKGGCFNFGHPSYGTQMRTGLGNCTKIYEQEESQGSSHLIFLNFPVKKLLWSSAASNGTSRLRDLNEVKTLEIPFFRGSQRKSTRHPFNSVLISIRSAWVLTLALSFPPGMVISSSLSLSRAVLQGYNLYLPHLLRKWNVIIYVMCITLYLTHTSSS